MKGENCRLIEGKPPGLYQCECHLRSYYFKQEHIYTHTNICTHTHVFLQYVYFFYMYTFFPAGTIGRQYWHSLWFLAEHKTTTKNPQAGIPLTHTHRVCAPTPQHSCLVTIHSLNRTTEDMNRRQSPHSDCSKPRSYVSHNPDKTRRQPC